jgi:signal transduction histidine kinase
MKFDKQRAAVVIVVFAVIGLTFSIFDYYTRQSADDLMNAVMRSEAASIQQGNILNSVTKLQSAVQTSESLRGVAVFDKGLETHYAFPLIELGEMPSLARLSGDHMRVGLFAKVYVRPLNKEQSIVFYFQPRFVFWTYILFAGVLAAFSLLLAWLGRRIESIRAEERAQVFFSISEQISHDVKSPLSALNLLGGVIKRTGGPADLLLQSVKRIEDIVNDLRDQSETLSSRFGEKSKFRVDECVSQIVAEKRLQHPDYAFSFASARQFETVGPSAQFGRVVSNLLNNAVEASPEHSEIQVELTATGDLTIRDHGRGIAHEDLTKLFAKGFTKNKKQGSGLGLFHARQVLNAINGKINLESKPGEGTTVRIALLPAR